MTKREALLSVIDDLDDAQIDQFLDVANAIRRDQGSAIAFVRRGDSAVGGDPAAARAGSPPMDTGVYEEPDDELAHAVPKRPFAPGSSAWDMVGFIDTDGPADMGSDKYKHFAEVYGSSPEE